MALINIKIEGIPFQVEEGITILEAARRCGFEIPTLCSFNNGECSKASCRVCLVEATGARGLVASCVYPVSEGMEITISSPKATRARRISVELLLSNHHRDCQRCSKNGHCELLHVAQITGVREELCRIDSERTPATFDYLSPSIVRDTSKCILCGRCIERCKNAQGIGVLGFENRGFNTILAPAENRSFVDTPCISCGQCVAVCPTGALMEKSEIKDLDYAMKAGMYVVVQTAPAVRAAIAEEFGNPIGTLATGKMVAALKRLGFKKVFDTNFAADLTIMEEASELMNRIQSGGTLPMITSCSPGWINYAELNYPELLPHLSTCKSPHEMMGAILKTYYAAKIGVDPKNMYVVSIMPCTAKKQEKLRPQLSVNGLPDVDCVLTTRELAKLIKRAGIQFNKLPNEEFDNDIVGDYSGAGVIFGVTGGVMEAALRTAVTWITGNEPSKVEMKDVRGFEGIKEASYDLNGTKINIAVASGMKNAKVLLEDIKAGNSKYHFIEVMGCPGGCICGGGQPYVKPAFLPNEDLDILDTFKNKRAAALYKEDEGRPIRLSHKNPQIKELYDKFLEKPNSHLAHELLHTTYEARVKFPESENKL